MNMRTVGVLGASSPVGRHIVPLLQQRGDEVLGFSRERRSSADLAGIRWLQLNQSPLDDIRICWWVCLAPIWVLPDCFELLLRCGACKVIALSSMSRFSKQESSSDQERELAQRLADAEQKFQSWAKQHGIEWVILRPTLIYGEGRDRNVSDIARFLLRWRIFPLVGNGCGLRQPLHAGDVAEYCVQALISEKAANLDLNICGGETLSYREMVTRIGIGMTLSVRFVPAPRPLLRFGVWLMSRLPRFKKLSPALVDRMTQDLVVDGTKAQVVLGVRPRPFVVTAKDLPFSNKQY